MFGWREATEFCQQRDINTNTCNHFETQHLFCHLSINNPNSQQSISTSFTYSHKSYIIINLSSILDTFKPHLYICSLRLAFPAYQISALTTPNFIYTNLRAHLQHSKSITSLLSSSDCRVRFDIEDNEHCLTSAQPSSTLYPLRFSYVIFVSSPRVLFSATFLLEGSCVGGRGVGRSKHLKRAVFPSSSTYLSSSTHRSHHQPKLSSSNTTKPPTYFY